jgi:hypothetical protein
VGLRSAAAINFCVRVAYSPVPQASAAKRALASPALAPISAGTDSPQNSDSPAGFLESWRGYRGARAQVRAYFNELLIDVNLRFNFVPPCSS